MIIIMYFLLYQSFYSQHQHVAATSVPEVLYFSLYPHLSAKNYVDNKILNFRASKYIINCDAIIL